MATPFYLTMAVMFSVSNSVICVTVAHSCFYFRNLHATATSGAFSHPVFVLILLINTAIMIAILQGLSHVLPPALPLEAPQYVPRFEISLGNVYAAVSFVGDLYRLYVYTRRYIRDKA